ncbi:Ort1p [Kluyveromyces lactis]|uniref:KLLA0E02839p n=1 Tax=Kluyveromyces lactis (strain ATCC 8585 / CBS 2359 / DSM 70799 / NBRC 1267 / NRRL Y-1140 / WM37) TaxID=284590 RepID=Q6CPR6_KLULA|nr:uncharacterized protein KLLA0_E02839g [Kluyveromyces lactis]CAG99160.1 KLLA0E02839p [Kluyveromyces lactis]|eukprot:XP_454073.1 uncharacterized protein KLLA0_E02839g [Kluyveromyces lactis]
MSDLESALKDIAYGSVAGAIGKVIEYPFDTVKVRLQTQPAHLYPTTWSCIRSTYTDEGIWKGFYQGIASPLFGAALENAVLFVSFNQCTNFLDEFTQLKPLTKTIYSGAFAGACASFILTPVELVKCKLQVSNISNSLSQTTRHTSVWPTIKSVIKEKGLLGLWQGQLSTFVRECLGGAVWFTTYEIMKMKFASLHPAEKENHTWELLVSGASAGVLFNASVFPADTVKSVCQTEHVSIVNALKKVLRTHGITGFYRGLGITLIRAAPANATVFYTYETLKKMF